MDKIRSMRLIELPPTIKHCLQFPIYSNEQVMNILNDTTVMNLLSQSDSLIRFNFLPTEGVYSEMRHNRRLRKIIQLNPFGIAPIGGYMRNRLLLSLMRLQIINKTITVSLGDEVPVLFTRSRKMFDIMDISG